jgi:hypothetical protein
MPIRLIAKELYRLQREVEEIEKELQAAPPREQDSIRDTLRKKRAEWQQVRNILDGEKAHAANRSPHSSRGRSW